LYEAAQVDGASLVKRFLRVTLPCLTQTIFTVTVLSVLNTSKVFREAYLMSGSYPHDSAYMLQHLFNNWFLTLDVDRMYTTAVMTAAVVFALIAVLQKAWGREAGQCWNPPR
jgi:multiple sugar transport system permease protein